VHEEMCYDKGKLEEVNMAFLKLPAFPQLVVGEANKRAGIFIALLMAGWCAFLAAVPVWVLENPNRGAIVFCAGLAWASVVIAAIIAGSKRYTIGALLLAPILFVI